MRRILCSVSTLLSLFARGLLPSAQAQSLIPATGTVGPCDFTTGDFDFDCIPFYIGYLITVLFAFAAGAFLVGIILGGYKYAIGSVTTEGKEAGKKQLTGAVLGFVVVVLSYLLVDTILEALL